MRARASGKRRRRLRLRCARVSGTRSAAPKAEARTRIVMSPASSRRPTRQYRRRRAAPRVRRLRAIPSKRRGEACTVGPTRRAGRHAGAPGRRIARARSGPRSRHRGAPGLGARLPASPRRATPAECVWRHPPDAPHEAARRATVPTWPGAAVRSRRSNAGLTRACRAARLSTRISTAARPGGPYSSAIVPLPIRNKNGSPRGPRPAGGQGVDARANFWIRFPVSTSPV